MVNEARDSRFHNTARGKLVERERKLSENERKAEASEKQSEKLVEMWRETVMRSGSGTSQSISGKARTVNRMMRRKMDVRGRTANLFHYFRLEMVVGNYIVGTLISSFQMAGCN